MYQQGYQDGPNGNGQERGWYADPPYQDAPAPRRRSRSRAQADRDAAMQAPSQMPPQSAYGYAQNGVSHAADQPGGYHPGAGYQQGGYNEPAYGQGGYREPNSYPEQGGHPEPNGYHNQPAQPRGGYSQNPYGEPAMQQPYGYDEPVSQRGYGYDEPAMQGGYGEAPASYGQGGYPDNYREPAGYPEPNGYRHQGGQGRSGYPQTGYNEPAMQRGQQMPNNYGEPAQNPYGYNEPGPHAQGGQNPYPDQNGNPEQGNYRGQNSPHRPNQPPYNGYPQNGYNEPAPMQRGQANQYSEPAPQQDPYHQNPYYAQGQPNQPQNSHQENNPPHGGSSPAYGNNQQQEPVSYGAGYRPAQQENAGGYQGNSPAPSGNGGAGAPPNMRNLIIVLVTLLLVVGGIILLVTATRDTTNQPGNNTPPVSTEGQPIITLNKNQASAYATKFLPNVYVDGICLADMTFQEGSDAVWAQAQEKQSGWYVRLKNENGNYKDITADMLGISFDPTSALQQAWAIGHTPDQNGQVSDKALTQAVNAALATEYHFTSAQQSANTSPIDTILDTLQTNAYRAPQDAVILSFNPDDFVNPFTFQQEVWGQWLDISAVKQEILNMVSTLESGEVLLTITPIAPNVTVADLQKTVTLRCRAVTPISSNSTEDRTNNIRVAMSKINGKSLAHGDKFSFNKFVGRRSIENGFFQAIEYAYGEEVMGVGGGVCQASTTVYLAAVQSGMTITNREAHSNPVNYTSLGMDATVSDTRGREVDFTFKNESGGRIFIAAHVVESGSNRRSLLCEVRIYGPSLEDVHYKLESETIEVLPKPEEPKLKEDNTGEHAFFVDETKMASKGREGYVVDTYLCTYQGDTLISREKISTDTYPARQDVMWVGINER